MADAPWKMLRTTWKNYRIIAYCVLFILTAYSASGRVMDFYQCVEEEKGWIEAFLTWTGLKEEIRKCPTAYDVVKDVCLDAVLFLVVVLPTETVIRVASFLLPKFLVKRENPSGRKRPTYFLIEPALRQRGVVLIEKLTEDRDETFWLNPRTRKFQRVLSLPRTNWDEFE